MPPPAGPRCPGTLPGCPAGDSCPLVARPGRERSPLPSGTFPGSAPGQGSRGAGAGPLLGSRRSCPCARRGCVLQTHAMRWQEAAFPKFFRVFGENDALWCSDDALRHTVGFLGCSAQGQELQSVMLMAPFPLSTVCDSAVLGCRGCFSSPGALMRQDKAGELQTDAPSDELCRCCAPPEASSWAGLSAGCFLVDVTVTNK